MFQKIGTWPKINHFQITLSNIGKTVTVVIYTGGKIRVSQTLHVGTKYAVAWFTTLKF